MPEFLTIKQYAERRKVNVQMVYRAIEFNAIVPNTTHIAGKRLIDWEVYETLPLGDRSIAYKRKIIHDAKKEIKAELKEELRKEFQEDMVNAVVKKVKEAL